MLEHLKIVVKVLRNKYITATLMFIVWLTFFDQTSFIYDMHLTKQVKQLKVQQKYYENETQVAVEQLKELQTNPANLEKFAREKYLMKKDNEDVYIFVDQNNHLLDTIPETIKN